MPGMVSPCRAFLFVLFLHCDIFLLLSLTVIRFCIKHLLRCFWRQRIKKTVTKNLLRSFAAVYGNDILFCPFVPPGYIRKATGTVRNASRFFLCRSCLQKLYLCLLLEECYSITKYLFITIKSLCILFCDNLVDCLIAIFIQIRFLF